VEAKPICADCGGGGRLLLPPPTSPMMRTAAVVLGGTDGVLEAGGLLREGRVLPRRRVQLLVQSGHRRVELMRGGWGIGGGGGGHGGRAVRGNG